jgi:hypothetical protein
VLGDDFEVEEELMATQNGGLIEMGGGRQQQDQSYQEDQQVEESIPEDISTEGQ